MRDTMGFKICRVCLDRTATISLFNKEEVAPYYSKIMRCAAVVIEEGDGLPDAICERCSSDLAVTYAFVQRCEASDNTLRMLHTLQPVEHDIKVEFAPINEDEHFTDCDLPVEHHELDLLNGTIKIEQSEKIRKTSRMLPDHLRKRRARVKTGPVKCPFCDRVVNSRSALEVHMRTHTKEKPYSCDYCQKSFTIKHSLKNHIRSHLEIAVKRETKKKAPTKRDPLQCVTCGKLKPHLSAMRNHMRTHTGETPFSCHMCGEAYKLKGTLQRHMNTTHHEAHPHREYRCHHCHKIFYLRNNLIIHLRTHSGERPYQCRHCPKSFTQSSSLLRHTRSHIGDRPHSCHICGRSFVEKSVLQKHQSVHSTEKRYRCHICDKAIKTKHALKIHIESHSRTKLFVCNICGMTFTFKGNMKTHMRRKHSERSGTCTVCDKECGDLALHMYTHSGKKPFNCKICDRNFGSQRSLTYHIRYKHRDTDKFKCTMKECSESFPLAHMLEFHLTKQHGAGTSHVCPHCARPFLRPGDLTKHLKHNHLHTHNKLNDTPTQIQVC